MLSAEKTPVAGLCTPQAKGGEPATVLDRSGPTRTVGVLATQVWRAWPQDEWEVGKPVISPSDHRATP